MRTKAQDYQNAFLVAGNNMRSLNNYSMLLHCRLYVDDNTGKPFQERKIQIYRKEKNLYLKSDNGVELLTNNNYQITIDAGSRTMLVSKRKKGEKIKQKKEYYDLLFNSTVESLPKVYEKINTVYRTNDNVCYEMIYKPNERIEKSRIVIDTKRMVYTSIKYTYKRAIKLHELGEEKHKVEYVVSFENLELNRDYDLNWFDEKKYLICKGQRLMAAAKYKKFNLKVLNHD